MAISDWPSAERPREKLIRRGAGALSDAELLAIFLRTGVAGSSAVDLARQLLLDYGSLRRVLETDAKTFCAGKGLGLAKFAQLQAALEIAGRHLAENLGRGDCLTKPSQTRSYLRACLRDYDYEVFACLMLDNRNRVIAFRELFRGTIDGAAVYPREVVKQALADNAAAVILAHNHPSGVCEASQADIRITERLQKALALVDIRVLDHVIVGDGITCLSEQGLV
ncbi:MAG: DNA repair protein RadC [Chromatiales bacterium]|jgi:DNA repair protein RadC|nr:DNA repair protein RadC [Chromatiales bacterium]